LKKIQPSLKLKAFALLLATGLNAHFDFDSYVIVEEKLAEVMSDVFSKACVGVQDVDERIHKLTQGITADYSKEACCFAVPGIEGNPETFKEAFSVYKALAPKKAAKKNKSKISN
jgi:hypothetical protein